MQKKQLFSILILLGVNILLLTRFFQAGSRSTEMDVTLHTLEQEKENVLRSSSSRKTPTKAPTEIQAPTSPSPYPIIVSTMDENEIQRVLQYADNLQKTSEALTKIFHGSATSRIDIFNEESLALYWKNVEMQKQILITNSQRLSHFVERLDLSMLKPEEADLVRQYVDWRNKASNILYDLEVPIQEKVDVCKRIAQNQNDFDILIRMAIDATFGDKMLNYQNLHTRTKMLIWNPPSQNSVGHHYYSFNNRPYIITIPEGYQPELIEENSLK